MYITLSKSNYEKFKSHLQKLDIRMHAEITQQGLYHITLPDMSGEQSKKLFYGYMDLVKEDPASLSVFPAWLKYLNPAKKTDTSEKERSQKDNEYAEH